MKSPVVRELRAVQRFAVNLPVLISWRAVGRPMETAGGHTRDISTRGMFVVAPAGPRAGELLRFAVDMALDESSTLLRVQGEGRVVRVERPAQASRLAGFAVHNLWFKLREPEAGQALPARNQSQAGRMVRATDNIRGPVLPRRLAIVRPNSKKFSD